MYGNKINSLSMQKGLLLLGLEPESGVYHLEYAFAPYLYGKYHMCTAVDCKYGIIWIPSPRILVNILYPVTPLCST